MLTRLLQKKTSGRNVESRPADTNGAAASRAPEPRRIAVLIPADGSMSFRLHWVRDEEAATALVAGRPGGGAMEKIIAFQALHQLPNRRLESDEPPEALVMTRDPGKPGVIHLCSFIDMESAYSFVRYEAGRGLDLRQVLVFWAIPIVLRFEPTVVAAAPHAARQPSYVEDEPPPWATETADSIAPVGAPSGVEAVTQPASDHSVFQKPKPVQQSADSGLRQVLGWRGWRVIRRRAVLATLLKETAYEDAERDRDAKRQVQVVVFLAALAAGVGAVQGGPIAIVLHILALPLGWLLYAHTVHWMGTKLFEGRSDEGSWHRVRTATGFASAPMFLLVLAAIPLYGALVPLLVLCYATVTTVVACKHTLEVDETSAAMIALSSTLAFFAVGVVAPAILLSQLV